MKDITQEVKGKLIWMAFGTSTIVNNRVINTSEFGNYIFYPKELKCEIFNEDLN